MLSNRGLRSYGIRAFVTDDIIRLLYFDCSVIIVSPALNFLEDSSRFIAMLMAVTDLLLQQWGFSKATRSRTTSSQSAQRIYSMAWQLSDNVGSCQAGRQGFPTSVSSSAVGLVWSAQRVSRRGTVSTTKFGTASLSYTQLATQI